MDMIHKKIWRPGHNFTQRLFHDGKLICCLCTNTSLCIRELILLKKIMVPTPAFPPPCKNFSVLANAHEIPDTADAFEGKTLLLQVTKVTCVAG